MYQVNFLPWRIRQQRQRYRFWLCCFCVQLFATLLILVLTYGVLGYQQDRHRQVLQALEQQYSDIGLQFKQRQQMMGELARLGAEEARYRQNHAHNQRYLALLRQLSRALPETLWLTEFEENAKGISLRGIGRHYAAIAVFEQRLAALPLLQGSRLTEVTQHKEGGLAFTLTARWGLDG